MSMEKYRCKLCPRVFSNGRALGGHMRSHLATLPPTTPKKKPDHPPQLGDRAESDSSSTHSATENEPSKDESNPVGSYGLRENPKKSAKASDPEFLDAGSVVQDGESETESTQNPIRRRSTKRPSQRVKPADETIQSKKLKSYSVKTESATESAPVSSVSDTSQDEEVALCLMMLSRDVWVNEKNTNNNNSVEETDSAELIKRTQPTRRGGLKCLACKKRFRTEKALDGHKSSSKECQLEQKRLSEDQKKYECPFCYKVFGSGQALGGHKRSHLLGSSNTTNPPPNHDHHDDNGGNNDGDNDNHDHHNLASSVDKVGDTTSFILDLNLPAPIEDDDEQQS